MISSCRWLSHQAQSCLTWCLCSPPLRAIHHVVTPHFSRAGVIQSQVKNPVLLNFFYTYNKRGFLSPARNLNWSKEYLLCQSSSRWSVQCVGCHSDFKAIMGEPLISPSCPWSPQRLPAGRPLRSAVRIICRARPLHHEPLVMPWQCVLWSQSLQYEHRQRFSAHTHTQTYEYNSDLMQTNTSKVLNPGVFIFFIFFFRLLLLFPFSSL